MALAFLVFSIILLIIYFGFTNILTKRWAFWRYTFFSLVLLVLATSFLTDIWTGIILYGLILFFSASTFPFLFKKNKGKQPVYGRFVLAETGFATGFCAFMLSLQTLLLWFLPNELVITISSLIQFIYLLMPLSYIIYYLIDHDLLNSDYFVAIYQSTWNGVKNFAKTAFSLKGYMAIIMSIVIIIGGLYCLNGLLEVKLPQATQQIIAMLVLCIVSFFNMKAAFKKSIFYIIVVESLVYLKGLKEWQKYKTKNPAAAYLDGEKTAKEQNYVLVIGESQSRDHLSAYGYARSTTPWLNEKKQDDDFILFKNAYSCHVMTAYVMAKVLTESNQYNQKPFSESFSLLNIAKLAGFKTYYISNQDELNAVANPATLIAKDADVLIMTSDSSNAANSYDMRLAEELEKLKAEPGNKLIIIHLYGNHFEYKDRYPEEFNIFNGQRDECTVNAKNPEKLCQYDNSIVYTDHVLKELHKIAVNKFNVDAFVYFSDHSDAVERNKKHVSGQFGFDMARIPLWMYFSKEYQARNSEKLAVLRESKNKYITNDLMYDTMLGIMGITTDRYASKQDLSSEDYAFTKESLLTLNGKISLSEDI